MQDSIKPNYGLLLTFFFFFFFFFFNFRIKKNIKKKNIYSNPKITKKHQDPNPNVLRAKAKAKAKMSQQKQENQEDRSRPLFPSISEYSSRNEM